MLSVHREIQKDLGLISKKQQTYDIIENFKKLRLVNQSCIILPSGFDANMLSYIRGNEKKLNISLSKTNPYGITQTGTIRNIICIKNQTCPSSHAFSTTEIGKQCSP